MYLNASAIEFEFERCRSEFAERGGYIFRSLRQHGLHRPEELDNVSIETGLPGFERRSSDASHVAGHHHGAAQDCRADAGRNGQRFEHQSFQRTLPDIAEQQTFQEILFGLGRPRKQGMQQGALLLLRAASLDDGERLQDVVHITDLQAGFLRSGRGGVS